MPLQQFSESLPMLLYGALDAVMPRFRRIFNDFSLTEQQWRVLRVLWEHDELAFRDLSGLTLIPAPSLVGVVDRLNAVGLVERRRSEHDRRQVYVLATERGRDLERQVMPRVVDTYAELRASVDPETWDRLIAGLGRICALGEGVTAKCAPGNGDDEREHTERAADDAEGETATDEREQTKRDARRRERGGDRRARKHGQRARRSGQSA